MTDWSVVLPGSRFHAPFAAGKRKASPLGPAPRVLHVAIPYRQWSGPIGPWSEHFGKGKQQVHSLHDSLPLRSCNEVEVVKLLRSAGRHAYWISCYNPSKLPDIWKPFALAPSAMPAWLQTMDREIRTEIPHRTGGIPDVASWLPDDPANSLVFVECKGPSEGIKENQEDWVFAAHARMSADRFAVAVRTFS